MTLFRTNHRIFKTRSLVLARDLRSAMPTYSHMNSCASKAGIHRSGSLSHRDKLVDKFRFLFIDRILTKEYNPFDKMCLDSYFVRVRHV